MDSAHIGVDSHLATESVNGASPIAFLHDRDGLVTQAGEMLLSRNLATGLLAGSTLGGVVETREHNLFGETSRVAYTVFGTPLLETLYVRDALGRIVAKTETLDGVATLTEYGYDRAGRIETVTIDGTPAVTYSWDSNGNRLARDTAAGTELAAYDAQDRLLSHGDATFTWTANGELATKTDAAGTTAFLYDALGNLRRANLPDGRVVEYVIDARNRRVGKRIDGVLVQGFLYRDQLEPVAELDGAGNVVSRFVYGGKGHVPDYMVKAGVTYRIVSDDLGSPRIVINTATGAIAQRMDFDEWGNVTLDTAPGFQPFGFAGGLLDLDTGLTRFGARDYSPEIGRWTAKDPIRFYSEVTNFYAYVEDPINQIDINGLKGFGTCYRECSEKVTGIDPFSLENLLLPASGGNPLGPGWEGIGAALWGGGQATEAKRFVTPGSSPGTSVWSQAGRALGVRLPFKVWAPTNVRPLATTNKLGAALGRWAPIAGLGFLGLDAWNFLDCLADCGVDGCGDEE